MPSLKAIRKRISSVKSTQKITRAMKMVAGARLQRAQRRITELRPYAVKTQEVLREVTASGRRALGHSEGGGEERHPLLEVRPEKNVLLVVLTSDRGLCGAFNTNINKLAEQEWRRRTADGQTVHILAIGRKGRDYFRRRGAPLEYVDAVWDKLDWDTARLLGRRILSHFLRPNDPVDAIYLVYNEFKSAISQRVTAERLLPIADEPPGEADDHDVIEQFVFEPSEDALLAQLIPMYVQVSILRALLESMASELGARMTAMDAATNNASEMIAGLTLKYNRARQAAITKELMEIIGGSESLKG
jgi:F-type H+-transporting ATPase subunit gamma